MMLWRRSVTAVLSPLKQVAAVRSFTATVAIKVDEQEDGTPEPMNYKNIKKEFFEIHNQLRSLNNGLINLRERLDDDELMNVQHLGAMIQNEGRKTRSTRQHEEKKPRSTKHRGTYHHHYLYFAQ